VPELKADLPYPTARGKAYASPFRLLALIAVSVFVIEALVMILLLGLPPMPHALSAPLDALLVTILMYPVLYRNVVRPMSRHIDERRQAEAALRCAHDDLETRVAERTAELAQVNQALRAEIAERQRVDSELRASEERFRLALQNAPVAVAAQDRDLRFLWAYNQRTVDPSAVIGKTDTDLFPPEDAARLIALKRKVLETETETRGQLWLTSGDKRVFLDLYLEPLRDAAGQVTGIGIATVDLTEIKRVEAALRESEADLKRAQAVAHIGSWRLDTRRNALWWSDETYRIFGIPLGTPLTYEVFLANVHPDDREHVDQRWAAALRGEPYNIEHRIVVDGGVEWVRERAELEFDEQGTLLGGFGTVQDITALKQSQETATWLASFPELNPDPVVEVDLAGQVHYLNPAAKRLMPDLEAAGDQHPWLASLEAVGRRFQSGDASVVTREVTVGAESYQQTIYRVPNSQRVRLYSLNISKRKHAEAQVEQARRRAEALAQDLQAERDILDTIMENTSAQLAYLDPDFNFVRVNSAYALSSGHSREELLGRNHFAWFPSPENQAIFERVRETGQPVVFYAKPFAYVDQPERGITYWDWSLVPLKDQAGCVRGLVFSLMDVTQLKRAEEVLRIAHDELELRVQERTEELATAEEELIRQNAELLAAHQQAQAERQRYSDLFEFAPDAYLVTDVNGHIQEANAAAGRSLNIARTDLIGKPLTVFIAESERQAFRSQLSQLGQLDRIQEWVVRFWPRTSMEFDAELTVATVYNVAGKPIALRWLLRDITERKQAEKQRRIQSAALEAAANGIIITDRRGTIEWCNPAFSRMTGYSAGEVLGQCPRILKSGQHGPDFYRQLWETIRAGQVWHGELINRRKEGAQYTEEQTITPVLDEQGNISHFIAIKQDVTERKRDEEAIRLHAARAEALSEVARALAEARLDYQTVLDIVGQSGAKLAAGSCVIRLISEDGQWLKVVTAHHPDPAIGDALRQGLAVHTYRVDEGLLGQVVRTGQPVLLSATSAAVLHTALRPEHLQEIERFGPIASAVIVPLRLRGRTIGVLVGWRDPSQPPFTRDDQLTLQRLADRAALAIDNARLYRDLETAMREEQQTREQLVQTEKFAALGRMVAAVAHELNNPLQTIQNCLFLIQQDTAADASLHEYLNMAASEAQRLSNLVAQLRQLLRPGSASSTQALVLQHVLSEVRALLTLQLDAGGVAWQQVTLPGDLEVCGVADQLKQVFLNISLNAIDAMQPAGGRLVVSSILSPEASQVGVIFQDTGPGIPPDNLSKLFEPFFTTKSSGLGLGLPICYEIVQRHGGHILVDSQPGQGAAFTVWLPLARSESRDQEHPL